MAKRPAASGNAQSRVQSRVQSRAAELLGELKKRGSKRFRDAMGPRFGIFAKHAYGVPIAKIQALAQEIGRDHKLAAALWKTGLYEARLLAAFIDEPGKVSPAQMDRWAKDFDNWGLVDTVCFKLFDQTPHAFGRVDKWAQAEAEFVKRAAFALLASLALHTKNNDGEIAKRLALIEKAATDERNFVKKGVSWALRAIGGKRPKLAAKAHALAAKLAASDDAAKRWIGKDAMRDFTRKA